MDVWLRRDDKEDKEEGEAKTKTEKRIEIAESMTVEDKLQTWRYWQGNKHKKEGLSDLKTNERI